MTRWSTRLASIRSRNGSSGAPHSVDQRLQCPHRRQRRARRVRQRPDVGLDQVEQRQPIAVGGVADVVDEAGEAVDALQVGPRAGRDDPQRDREVLGRPSGRPSGRRSPPRSAVLGAWRVSSTPSTSRTPSIVRLASASGRLGCRRRPSRAVNISPRRRIRSATRSMGAGPPVAAQPRPATVRSGRDPAPPAATSATSCTPGYSTRSCPACCTRSASTRSTPAPRAPTSTTPTGNDYLDMLAGFGVFALGPPPPGRPAGDQGRDGRRAGRPDPVRRAAAGRPAGRGAAGQGRRTSTGSTSATAAPRRSRRR